METINPTKLIEITSANAGYRNEDFGYYAMHYEDRFTLKLEDKGYIFRLDSNPIIGWSGHHKTKKDCILASIDSSCKVFAWPIELYKPKSNLAEVLHTLITTGSASIKEFYWQCGFRTRISEISLKYGLSLNSKPEKEINKYGREYKFTVHYLPAESKEKAIEIYQKINK